MRKQCGLWLLLSLAACSGRDYEPPEPEIGVYQDRFEYRGETYATVSALAVGLTAANADAVGVDIRECVARERLVDLVVMLRQAGHEDVTFALPADC